MRQPNEIEIGEKTLEQVLADHLKWLRDKPDGIRANLFCANLEDANLSSANLSSADLRYANLSSANLSSADLSSANLRYANLFCANLEDANLSSANLSSADLSSANLEDANLSSANLSSADLSSANLRYAVGVLSIGPVGSRRAILIAVKHEKAIFIKAGCFWGTLQEFAGAVDETHGENKHAKNYKAAIALIETFFAED